MSFVEAFIEKESSIKHSPKDILLFGIAVACVFNLYLYFRLFDSADKTEIVINTGESGSVMGAESSDMPVYVSGAVNFPGVYFLKEGNLVSDLIGQAGGFSQAANVMWLSKNLNLSGKLESNSRVYIPFSWDTEYEFQVETEVVGLGLENDDNDGEQEADGGLVNVNTASLTALDALEGIGPTYAQRIIDNRPYSDFEDFKTNSGLSENLANSLSEYVKFN